jgi:tRNA threonylcarbamoyladenosine biosynthesis protein TsaE
MEQTVEVTKGRLGKLAEKVLERLVPVAEKKAVFVALHGDLGSGKTAFVKEIAKLLGLREDIVSPTFILKKEYDVALLEVEKLIHVDAYRLTSPKEGRVLLLDEDDRPKRIIFIEWPENVEKRGWDAELHFSYVSEQVRKIEINIPEKA